MNIALIGATGQVGSRLLSESLGRGHDVTAIVRDPEKLPIHPNLTAAKADVTNVAELARLLAAHDVAISAFNPGADAGGLGAPSIIEAANRSGVPRLLVVGGAGTLEVAPGKRLIDQSDFPAQFKEGALRTAAFLDLLRNETALDWVFLSPPAMLVPGTRTGHFRVGGDQLMTDGNGESRISLEDFAVAMLDEAERQQHHRQRFSVAY